MVTGQKKDNREVKKPKATTKKAATATLPFQQPVKGTSGKSGTK